MTIETVCTKKRNKKETFSFSSFFLSDHIFLDMSLHWENIRFEQINNKIKNYIKSHINYHIIIKNEMLLIMVINIIVDRY